ncbi:predicted protein [Sclerotinia sclerotiorum 1980 UF-70]|uniref:Uncharacterized protein n=1 Tax=Sclerotinia sclerotiorum (strain ATCC 18683 / 1980 / Ss-1) TaxID=665079 RepID=A7ESQ5_SCLS1|nr:predicted protein [Sclerotinia sclerotiorum 1980 UF-70]EDN92497.1 predicted protein [Sclerotinia sclerotiorum 1980 UF-70]
MSPLIRYGNISDGKFASSSDANANANVHVHSPPRHYK